MTSLTIEARAVLGKRSKKLAAAGKMPAVFYGKKEVATPITVSARDFQKAWKEAGESTVVTLSGLGSDKQALIQDVVVDPVKGVPRHVDFYIVEKGQKVHVAVPLEFSGVAPAEKELGGTLVKVLHELLVEGELANLPHNLRVDVSSLKDFDSQILCRDILLPSGITLLASPEDVVALVSEVVEEVAEEAPLDLSSIEVEKKGKQEEAAKEGAES